MRSGKRLRASGPRLRRARIAISERGRGVLLRRRVAALRERAEAGGRRVRARVVAGRRDVRAARRVVSRDRRRARGPPAPSPPPARRRSVAEPATVPRRRARRSRSSARRRRHQMRDDAVTPFALSRSRSRSASPCLTLLAPGSARVSRRAAGAVRGRERRTGRGRGCVPPSSCCSNNRGDAPPSSSSGRSRPRERLGLEAQQAQALCGIGEIQFGQARYAPAREAASRRARDLRTPRRLARSRSARLDHGIGRVNHLLTWSPNRKATCPKRSSRRTGHRRAGSGRRSTGRAVSTLQLLRVSRTAIRRPRRR